jgi:hypothetical protein
MNWQTVLRAIVNALGMTGKQAERTGLAVASKAAPVLERAAPILESGLGRALGVVGGILMPTKVAAPAEQPTPPTTPASIKGGTPTQETKTGTTVSSAVIQAPARVSGPARGSETTLPGQVSPTATATEIIRPTVITEGAETRRTETTAMPARVVSTPPTGAGLIPTPPTPVGLGGGSPLTTETPRVGGITATPPTGEGTIPTPPSPVRPETVIPISQIIQQLLATEPERRMAELPLPEEITERGRVRPRRFEEVLSELITR